MPDPSSNPPPNRITIQNLRESCTSDPAESILSAILDSGIDYPHGCTTGLCGLCKSRLIVGQVNHLDYFESALSESERAARLILPCSALALSDCTITPVRHDAHMPMVRTTAATVRSVTAVTHDIVEIHLDLPAGVTGDFLPGQYASLTFPSCAPRDFSMACLPGLTHLTFLVRRVAGGEVTAAIFEKLKPGDVVTVKGPYGLAFLRETHTAPIVTVAGGSGLAPVLSILEAALDRGMTQEMHVFVGVRTARDVLLESRLNTLARHHNVTVQIALSEEHDAAYPFGNIPDVLTAALSQRDLTSWNAYVAGSPAMVRAASGALQALGLPGEYCYVDPFLSRADSAKSDHVVISAAPGKPASTS